MAESTLWWLLGGALVALELFTGSFYLLMLALGATAGALAAHLGWSPSAQLVAAAVIGSAAVVGLYLNKRRRPGDPSARSLRSVNLDVGETIQVDVWQPDGTASVKYRGAQWTVVRAPGTPPEPGLYKVSELIGNRLMVAKA
ncbi:NfeD family protein [Hydrogenophaga sp. SL48]|uniref:NfeD family protein n=1 Tax=Hydrogenophaga sp. SL48 TaxID=2806347 RepID=UPI001F4721CB|nr:NfeD family protein [Hydrogenophaga sp. SL48]UJW82640.1 NfeD family protein [Hydrogenophaga sp. SL48]